MLTPLGRRAIVRPLKDTATESGIIIPDGMKKEAPCRGEVVHAGECDRFRAGDTVLFKKYAADEIEDGREILLLLDENDVQCLVS
jgi:co-chaperonin GroES (HSP10)